jgi:hypothetical protein
MITRMGRRGGRRFIRVITAATAAAWLTGAASRPARAAAPACFPERTVSESVALRDDHLKVFGSLQGRQVVRVRDEPAAEGGKWSDVEIAQPVAVNGRTERRRLVVFARAEIEAQPGLAWLMAGAPLVILSGDDKRARVEVATLGEKPQLPAVEVPCALLRGTEPPDIGGPLHRDGGRGAGSRAVGWMGTRQLQSDAGEKSLPLPGGVLVTDGRRSESILLKQDGGRALVEVVDHYNWTRHRGWTPRDGLSPRPKVRHATCSCTPEAGWQAMTLPPEPRAKLAEAVALRSADDGRPIVTLPAGESVIALSVLDGRALVAWAGRTGGGVGPVPQPVLYGRVPTTAIAPLSASAVNAIVEGSIRRVEDSERTGPIIVKAEWRDGYLPLGTQAYPAPDGSFRLVAPVNRGSLTVWIETPQGDVLSPRENVRLQAGKTVRLNLKEKLSL